MSSFQEPWGIHWFRRDLRVAGNEALRENFRKSKGRTLGIFCFDSKFLSRKDFSANRFAFFLATLSELKKEMAFQGGELMVINELCHEAFPKLHAVFIKNKVVPPNWVSYGRDYEPFARKRDREMSAIFKKLGMEELIARDHLIQEPLEVMKDENGGFYQIYSPFAKKWFQQLHSEEMQKRIRSQRSAQAYFDKLVDEKLEKIFSFNWDELRKLKDFPYTDALKDFEAENRKNVTIPIPKPGFKAAFKHLLDFQEKLVAYQNARDIPSLTGTSQLSIYLKNGSLSSSQIFQVLGLSTNLFKTEGGAGQYAKEIVWREFYYSILYHRPDVEKNAFLSVYDDLAWSNSKKWFEHWKDGTTGFPIVDAGMRQLNQTGWMHNRVRMIVASFLTKDLLIDYRWGEKFFMEKLLDGDLAPNNGGWQWAASTGCDPQPYFRVFNPWLQGEKFDPDAIYIKKYIPELARVDAKSIHKAQADRTRDGYPVPIVDHSVQRDLAIALYKNVRSNSKSVK